MQQPLDQADEKVSSSTIKVSSSTTSTIKVRLSPSKKNCFICFDESPLKMMKNAFYFILKARDFRSQDI